jgi:hypothetical protein
MLNTLFQFPPIQEPIPIYLHQQRPKHTQNTLDQQNKNKEKHKEIPLDWIWFQITMRWHSFQFNQEPQF